MLPCILSIVIVNYNVRDLLIKCLESIYKNFDENFEIIVVDNNSTDRSIETVKEKYPAVRIIENNFNAGFPAANNQGFKITTGKYIFMLNPDTEITDAAITKLILFLDTNPKIAAVCPMLLNPDNSHQFSVWRFPNIPYIFAEMFYLNILIKSKYYLEKNFKQSFEVDAASGAALMFRKELLHVVGMLNEYLFWIEDVDFCFRIKKAGMKVMYYPEACVIHHIGQSAKKNYTVSISNQIFNKIKFYKVHHSVFKTLLLIVLSFFYSFLKFFLFLFLAPFNNIYFEKAKAYWFTIPRVFNPPSEIKK